MTGFGFFILCGINLLLLPCEGGIIEPPGGNNLNVLPGSNLTIDWNITDDETKVFSRSWFFTRGDGSADSEVLATISRNKEPKKESTMLSFFIVKPATLVLTNVDLRYNGTYQFSLQVPPGYLSSVMVYVAVRPTVEVCSNSITVNENANITCLCQGKDGNPPADVTWYKDNGEIIGKTEREENLLTLSNVTGTYNGTYKCVAKSYTLSDNKTIEVKVRPNSAPVLSNFTSEPREPVHGQSVTLRCEGSGRPPPTYIVFHNGTEKYRTVKNTSRIREVEHSDAGLYKCIAKNIIGTSQPLYYNLTVKPKVRPNVTINCSSTITVNESDSVRCLCEGKGGTPPANVTWFDKDGEMIGDVGNEEKMLTLNNVNETNNGTYECVAESYNLQDKESIQIIVNFKPKVTSLTFSPKDVYIGGKVSIECKASGYPAPSLTITLKDEGVLSNETMYELRNLSTSHAGSIITCTATNILGNDSQSKGLPLKVRPNVAINCSGTITVNKRDSVRCLCEGRGGYPPANVTWYKDGKIISDAGENMLTLDSIDETKIGTYKCVAQSYNLQANESIKIIFHDIKTDKTSDGGLSVGAIVGIVIGVLVLLVVVIVLARWKKNKEKDGHSRNVIVNSSNIDPANLYESVNDGSKAGGDNAGGSTSGNPPASANPSAVYAAVDKNRKNEPSVTYATLDSLAMQTNASEKRDNEPKREPTEYASINFNDMKGGPSVKKQ